MKLATVVILSLALMGCQAVVETPTGNVVATGNCAADTYTCTDGSVVNRNPAYGCEFNPCPGDNDPDIIVVEDNEPDTIIVEDNRPIVTPDNDVVVNNNVTINNPPSDSGNTSGNSS